MKQDLRSTHLPDGPVKEPPPPDRPFPSIHGPRRAGATPLLLLLVLGAIAALLWRAGALDWTRTTAPVAAPAVEGSPSAPATATVEPPAVPLHRLKLITHPDDASFTLTGSDGDVRTGRTPFQDELPEGTYDLTLSLKGYDRLSQQLVLDGKQTLDLWLDPKGLLHHKLGTWDAGPAPKQVAFSPDGNELWISDLGGHGVEVFDAATMKLLDTVKLGKHGAVEVLFSRDGSTVFASQMETASVFEIDRATRRVRRQMFTTGSWSKVMELSPDESKLYVSNWVSDDVSVIDLVTGEEVRRIPTVDTPRGLYVTADGRRLYVAGFGHGDLERIDLATGKSRTLISTGGAMRHLVGDEVHDLLYASDMGTDEVYVVDLATEQVRELARTDNTPNSIDLSPDGRVLYVSNRGKNNPISYYVPGPEWGSVLAIDTATGRYVDAIVGGNQTTGLDVSPDGRTLAFTDFLDNAVSLYAIPSLDVLVGGDGGRYAAHLDDLAK